MRNKVYIYRDYGCADVGVLADELRKYFVPRGCSVEFVEANDIIYRNFLNKEVLALFMPGGESTPYRNKLKVRGNERIRDFVREGGIYYGICAGAYYACKQTEFEKDLPQSRIVEEYELDLLNAKAVGSLYKELRIEPFAKNHLSSAAVELFDESGNTLFVHYHGGPYFELNEAENVEILARYNLEGLKPAVVLQQYGKGKVILSGVHYEDKGETLAKISVYKETAKTLMKNEAERQVFFNRLMNLSGR